MLQCNRKEFSFQVAIIDTEWLLFLGQLPTTPSSLRVNVWRRLKDVGASSLQNGVWILPDREGNALFLERLLVYVKQRGASGQILQVQALNQSVHADILARFTVDRNQEYDEFLEQCESFISELVKEIDHHKFTFAELEENEQNYKRLQKWLHKIQKRDFFGSQKALTAISVIKDCDQKLRSYTLQVYDHEGITSIRDSDFDSLEDY